MSAPHADSAERGAAWIVASAAAIVAAAVRVNGALHYAFWQDEVSSARIILERTPIGVVRHVARTESTPPAWYELGFLVHRLGVPVTEVRLLSVLFGAMLAAAVVVYARTMLPLWASGLAGLAVALGYQFVFHGRELRAYELHALLTVALAISAFEFIRAPSRRRAVALGLIVALGALTHYFFLLTVATVLLWIWTSASARPHRRRATLVVGAGLVPFAVWVPVMALQYRRHRFSFIGPFDGQSVSTAYWHLFARAEPRTAVLHEAAPLVLLVSVVVGCALLARRSDSGRLCALLAIAPLAAASLIWLAGPRIFDIRNLIGVGPFTAIALAALVTAIPRPAVAVAASLVVGLLVYGFIRADRVRPVAYDRVSEALVAEGWSARDPIVLFGNFYAFRSPLEWYLPGRPALTLGELGKTSCTRFFVVAAGSAGRSRTLQALFVEATRRVRSILIARVEWQGGLGDRRWRGGHLLVAKQGHSPCVRAVPEELLASRL
jgi:hypothetical protein